MCFAANFDRFALNAFKDAAIRSGGLGLRRVTDHCVVAFIASWMRSCDLMHRMFISMPHATQKILYKQYRMNQNQSLCIGVLFNGHRIGRQKWNEKNVRLHIIEYIQEQLHALLHEIPDINMIDAELDEDLRILSTSMEKIVKYVRRNQRWTYKYQRLMQHLSKCKK